jgi:acyl-CoA reductase-like NAD-dependent aldehyde dehydrogenase
MTHILDYGRFFSPRVGCTCGRLFETPADGEQHLVVEGAAPVKLHALRDQAYAVEEQRKAVLDARLDADAAERARIVEELATLVERATNPLRAVLVLHQPGFLYDTGSLAICEGCDYGGWEGDSPSWPCRTYTLIRDALNGVG